MNWDGRWVKPDKRKGKLVLLNGDDDLMYVRWHDREKPPTADPEMNLVVVNDVYLEKIDKCTTGRVYLLRFTSSPDKKEFFWMQEPKEDGDGDLITRFNTAVGATIPEGGAGGGATSGPASGDLAEVLRSFAANRGASGGAPADIDPQLASMVAQFVQSGGGGAPRTPVPLTSVMTSETLEPLLADEAAVAEMLPLLPEGQRSAEDLREALNSPQIHQSMTVLTQAIYSDQLPVLFAGLGLDPSSVGSTGATDALEALCRAMEAQQGGSEGGAGASAPGSG